MNITADWVMVVITAIYVIATIAICVFNYKSAKATREQVEESKRQFNESLIENKRQLAESKKQFDATNRPYVTCDYIFEKRLFHGIRIKNQGNKVAEKVTILVDSKFIGAITRETIKNLFNNLSNSVYTIGIDQSYEFYFSINSDWDELKRNPLKVEIKYCDKTRKYSETFNFNFPTYAPIQSIHSYNDNYDYRPYYTDIVDSLTQINSSLKRIHLNNKDEET